MARITGAKRHSQRLRALPRATRREVGKAIFVGSGMIQAETRHLIAQGAIQGAGHVPSAPGEPPNWDTGKLAGDIKTIKTGELTAETSSEAPYATALEFGTSKMAERPYMRPATKTERPKIVSLVRKAVSRAIRSTGRSGGR